MRRFCVYLLCVGLIAASFDGDDGWLPAVTADGGAAGALAGLPAGPNSSQSATPSIEQASQGRGFLSRESQSRWSASSRAKNMGRVFQSARAGLRSPTCDLPEALVVRLAAASLPALHVRLQI